MEGGKEEKERMGEKDRTVEEEEKDVIKNTEKNGSRWKRQGEDK